MSGCTAAMDVLTSAASAHEAASETHSSGETSQISSEAQILALKRKLIECDRSLNSAHERISGLEKALDIEKREHQLTTSKLTMLLKKRGASGAQCASAAPYTRPGPDLDAHDSAARMAGAIRGESVHRT